MNKSAVSGPTLVIVLSGKISNPVNAFQVEAYLEQNLQRCENIDTRDIRVTPKPLLQTPFCIAHQKCSISICQRCSNPADTITGCEPQIRACVALPPSKIKLPLMERHVVMFCDLRPMRLN